MVWATAVWDPQALQAVPCPDTALLLIPPPLLPFPPPWAGEGMLKCHELFVVHLLFQEVLWYWWHMVLYSAFQVFM